MRELKLLLLLDQKTLKTAASFLKEKVMALLSEGMPHSREDKYLVQIEIR